MKYKSETIKTVIPDLILEFENFQSHWFMYVKKAHQQSSFFAPIPFHKQTGRKILGYIDLLSLSLQVLCNYIITKAT